MKDSMHWAFWDKPVTIETATPGQYRIVSSAAEAALLLLGEWPVDESEAFVTAKSMCLLALEGTTPPEKAREAFLAAATEAGVFVRA